MADSMVVAESLIWVEWIVDGWWYPAICEKSSGSIIFFRWHYSGSWKKQDSVDVSKVCRRIETDDVPFALQTREAIKAHSAFALTNPKDAVLFSQNRTSRCSHCSAHNLGHKLP